MKNKIYLTLALLLLATPIAYASFIIFSPPHINKSNIPILSNTRPNRQAYKPYSGHRTELSIFIDNQNALLHMQSVGNSFKRADWQVDNAINDVDNAARLFDVLVTSR